MSLIEDIKQNVKEMSEHQVTYNCLVKKLTNLVGSEDLTSYDCLEKARSYVQEGNAKIEEILQAGSQK